MGERHVGTANGRLDHVPARYSASNHHEWLTCRESSKPNRAALYHRFLRSSK
jgi:hypothetical protein